MLLYFVPSFTSFLSGGMSFSCLTIVFLIPLFNLEKTSVTVNLIFSNWNFDSFPYLRVALHFLGQK